MATLPKNSNIQTLGKEARKFAPSPEFASQARMTAEKLAGLKESFSNDWEGTWASLARENLVWEKNFSQTLEWTPPFAQWFADGKLNASAQCLDKHMGTENEHKLALLWEGEPMGSSEEPLEVRRYTYRQLLDETARFASGLQNLGLRAGDRVAIYMPMIPEAVIAMLACARLGATHSVVFGGFSTDALRDRLLDAKARFVITATGGFRRGKWLPLLANVDAAVSQIACVDRVVVVDRLGSKGGAYAELKTELMAKAGNVVATKLEKKSVWYHDVLARALEQSALPAPTPFDSEHPLFILYTSGTTGKPKGVVHSTAGFLLWSALTVQWVFDPKPNDVYWCTADIGWVTGHTYVVYGPLMNASTVVMYEGAPDFPSFNRFWKVIERHKVSVFYTAPTAIRAFMRQGEDFPNSCDLSSLRLLGSVGEPINPEAWIWYRDLIGKARCPIVDTWWQTETGGVMISPLPGITQTKPGSATQPLPGISAEVVDDDGKKVELGSGGRLILSKPWPGMLRTIYGDPERYRSTYWSDFKGQRELCYVTGDGAHIDRDGYFWIMGRIDDVINVAGHRLGTAEIESALVSYPDVAEAAVVGKPDELKGTSIAAFVTLKKQSKGKNPEEVSKLLKAHVTKEIGGLARPDLIRFTDALPKTRSGKIMRRLLRDIAAGNETVGDTSTLEDLSSLANLKNYQDEG